MDNGEIVTQACNILRKVYSEINKLKADLSEILQTTSPTMEFIQEYSYGTNTLWVKDWHSILFHEISTDKEHNKEDEVNYFGVVIIFYDSGRATKHLENEKEPELWGMLVKVSGSKHKVGPWDFAGVLKDSSYLTPKELRTDGSIYKYLYDKKDKYGKWEGILTGCKLTEISSREKIEELVINKLFNL